MNKYLTLQDGTVFIGEAFGTTESQAAGEVVFNTGMTGYQEAITDPSYTNQLLTFTYPLIGTYGTDEWHNQSVAATCQSVIVRHLENEDPTEGQSISSFLKEQGIPGISEIDTRSLTKHIRTQGTMKTVLTNAPVAMTDFDTIYNQIDAIMHRTPELQDAIYNVENADFHVVVIDYGIKQAIIEQLMAHGCKVKVLPYTTDFETVNHYETDGVLISNGPDNPTDYLETLPLLKEIQAHYATAGICLGHQLLALANGATTHAMLFGHRGLNHPVELEDGTTILTSQNHGYAVDVDSLVETGLVVTATEENDKTVEGLRHTSLPVITVQYHPEANPGPTDAHNFFNQFNQLMLKETKVHA